MTGEPALGRGRQAFEAQAWGAAYELLCVADQEAPLAPEDLEQRGVVASSPGLYFVGLAFQYAFASMLVGGAGRDAEYVADHLCARTPADRQPPRSGQRGWRVLTMES